jgi:hypothetical protein
LESEERGGEMEETCQKNSSVNANSTDVGSFFMTTARFATTARPSILRPYARALRRVNEFRADGKKANPKRNPKMMRALIYTRFSSTQQREASTEDQARNCRRRIEAEGWQLTSARSIRRLEFGGVRILGVSDGLRLAEQRGRS